MTPTPQYRPTADLARHVVYAPDIDGAADPGEIVWTWVVYADDPHQGKDRPVLVMGRTARADADADDMPLGLMLSSRDRRRDDENWMELGSGTWDAEGRDSFVRLDRIILVAETGIRREGAILERARFDRIAARLRSEYGWA
jgi:hypothetical protein